MFIRKIKLEDAGKYLNMLKQLDQETDFMLYEPGERDTSLQKMEENIRSIISSNSLLLIAEENEEIVGFLSATRGGANRIKHSAYIVTGILKAYRGRGIGTTFFEGLEMWARETGITRLELTVMAHNKHAFHLYQKQGFKIEGVKEKSVMMNGIYIDEYYMAKLLI